jgi:hypothetical protein
MRPEAVDAAYLWDMQATSRRIARLIAGVEFEAYLEDEMTNAAATALSSW